jgi:hypothetical protein
MLGRWVRGYLTRGVVGVLMAAVSIFTFGETPLGIFLTLVGVSFSGFFGTFFSLATPIGGILRLPLISLGIGKIPILWIWLLIDMAHFLFILPQSADVVRSVQGWLGILTLGTGFVLIELIKVVPFVLKVIIFLGYGIMLLS